MCIGCPPQPMLRNGLPMTFISHMKELDLRQVVGRTHVRTASRMECTVAAVRRAVSLSISGCP